MIPETGLFLEDIIMPKPGQYVADSTEGITRVENLPKPKIVRRSRNYRRRPCPECGRRAYRLRRVNRTLHDLGDPLSGRPCDLHVTYSQHRCPRCNLYFNADMDDLALPKCHYTYRVVALAVRLVVESDLVIRSIGSCPNPWQENTALTYSLSQQADDARIEIYAVTGRLTKTVNGAPAARNQNSWMWDGTNERGDPVGGGVYFYRIHARLAGREQTVIGKTIIIR